jgi:hypothetical protein
VVTRADIIAVKRAARRAYLRKGDKQSAELMTMQINAMLGIAKKSTHWIVWKSCPWCKLKFDGTDHPHNHNCDKRPESASDTRS